MSEQNQSPHICPSCGGTGEIINPGKSNETMSCAVCGASLRYKGIEVKIEGHPDDVKNVSGHLLNQAAGLENTHDTIKNKRGFMGFFTRNKIKCRRFYENQSRVIDVTGLKAGIPQKFDFGLGSFKIDTKYQDANDQLRTLDMLQFGLCNDINGISDPDQKDMLLQKIIETKTRMIEIVINLSSPISKEAELTPHFNYLTNVDLVNLLLNFNSDAFTTSFRLEESLINFKNRISNVEHLMAEKLNGIHPDYKNYVLKVFQMLKAIRKLTEKFSDYSYYIPWQFESLGIDILRYSIVNEVNSLLVALHVSDRINNDRFIRDSYLVTEAKNYPDINRRDAVLTELDKVRGFCKIENIEIEIVDRYFNSLKNAFPDGKFE